MALHVCQLMEAGGWIGSVTVRVYTPVIVHKVATPYLVSSKMCSFLKDP